MRTGRKRRLDRGQVEALLQSTGLYLDAASECVEVTGGTFNTIYRLRLGDGSAAILKLAPEPTAALLGYERGILRTEAAFYEQAHQRTGVPVPEVLHAGFVPQRVDGDFLLMSELPGIPWHAQRRLGDSERQRLRHELGGLVARLHTMTGSAFGYPQESIGPLLSTWRAAFLAMVDAVLTDAERFAVELPRAGARIRDAMHAHADVLDQVPTAVLVHFDLWDGNLLVDQASGPLRISGVIDAERAFWGDPAADFVSLALFGDIEQDGAFLAGYRAAGGRVQFRESLRARLRLYRIYLYLIMLVEATPRGYTGGEHARMQRIIADRLQADLDAMDLTTGGALP